MEDNEIHEVVRILEDRVSSWGVPGLKEAIRTKHDPFKVLISCMLSLRTKDIEIFGYGFSFSRKRVWVG